MKPLIVAQHAQGEKKWPVFKLQSIEHFFAGRSAVDFIAVVRYA
jgi:hypothetical protein